MSTHIVTISNLHLFAFNVKFREKLDYGRYICNIQHSSRVQILKNVGHL